jgi:hypothetical protein
LLYLNQWRDLAKTSQLVVLESRGRSQFNFMWTQGRNFN